MFCTEVPYFFTVSQVQFIENRHVKLGRIGTGTHVKDEFCIFEMTCHPFKEPASFDFFPENLMGKVIPLIRPGEIVNDYDILDPFIIQLAYQTASDESCGSCNYYHMYLMLM